MYFLAASKCFPGEEIWDNGDQQAEAWCAAVWSEPSDGAWCAAFSLTHPHFLLTPADKPGAKMQSTARAAEIFPGDVELCNLKQGDFI